MPSPPERAPSSAPPAKRGVILAGLMMGVLLAALDQTIVGTSLPKIVASLGGFEQFSWLFAAYMLASTVVIPFAGKFSDLYGRRPVYLLGMGVFLFGSALCGLAGAGGDLLGMSPMTQLIVARGVQGLGGGVIFPVAIATIADLYAPSERGRPQGAFGAVWGVSSVIGPFLGGWIVDYAHVFGVDSWRWVFYVNLPVGAVAIAMVARHFPRVSRRSTAPIDHLGIATLTIALVSSLLITVWGGDAYAWGSPEILALGAITLGAFAAFLWAESRAEDPVVPLALFREPVFTVSAIASLLMGAGMFGIISFMPAYMQGVVGVSATYSGAALVPLSLSLVAASIVSGRLMQRWGYKPFTIAGTLSAALGFWLLSRLTARFDPPIALAVVETMIVGVGLGFTIQTYIVAVQNRVERRQVGAATSVITLIRTLGATVGVTVLGVLLNRRLRAELPANVDARALDAMLARPEIGGRLERVPQLLLSPDAMAALRSAPGGEAAIEGVRLAFSESVAVVFLAGIFIAAGAFAVTLFLKSHPLKGREAYAAEGEAEAAAPGAGH